MEFSSATHRYGKIFLMLKITELMNSLSEIREIFHSEADFQHALAWHIHKERKNCQVRLEYPFPGKRKNRKYLDIWLPDMKIAIELKYRTRKLICHQETSGSWIDLTNKDKSTLRQILQQGKELFELRNQGAQDTLRYDFIKDIQRLEQATGPDGPAKTGFAVFLTNDPLYWHPPRKTNPVDGDFRLDKSVIKGKKKLDWTEEASRGTKKGREKAIRLKKSYKLKWKNFSSLGEKNNQQFKYLAVKVAGQTP